MRRNMDMVQTKRDFDANFNLFSRYGRKFFAENRRGSREHRKKRELQTSIDTRISYIHKKDKDDNKSSGIDNKSR